MEWKSRRPQWETVVQLIWKVKFPDNSLRGEKRKEALHTSTISHVFY